jgi:hypothetical protein
MCTSTLLWAQTPHAPATQPSAGEQAPYDLSGYWVSVITQNWQFRMVVPGPGEYADIPINAQAKQFADGWKAAPDEAAGKQCEAYGAAVIMRVPERLHIHWLNADVLQVDTDAGMQTRLLHFEPGAPGAQMSSSLQGYSQAKWASPAGGSLLFSPPGANLNDKRYRSLYVTTDHLLPGLLRKNGVPYGPDTKMTEWWDLRTEPTGEQWLSISTKVQDPEYLLEPYIYDSVFVKEPDGSKWDPSACSLSS